MYSLDINFLKDRPDYKGQTNTGPRTTPVSMETRMPLFLGGAVAIMLLAGVGGLWLFLQQQTTNLEQKQAMLDQELGRLKNIDEQVKKINDEINQVTEETTALASVFNQIKPWSAMLQDLRDRIPRGVQIDSIQQTTGPVPPPKPTPTPTATPSPNASPTPSPSPANNAANQTAQLAPTLLAITGIANSFNDVNDFLLTLQKSKFFKDKETRLVSAKLVDNPTTVELPKPDSAAPDKAEQVQVKLPKVVQYTIQTTLTDLSASELLRELDRKGAVGLVTRIKTLQNKGVIQQ